VLATADEHVLLAVHDAHMTVAVAHRDVPGAEPPVLTEHRPGGALVAPVTAHDVRAAHHQLTRLAFGHRPALVVDQLDVGEEAGSAGEADLAQAVLGAQEEDARRRLGHPVPLHERQPTGLIGADQLLGDRRSPASTARTEDRSALSQPSAVVSAWNIDGTPNIHVTRY